MSCKLPNFTSLDSLGLPAKVLEASNVEEALKELMNYLREKVPTYSLNESESLDPQNYKHSIDLFIEEVLNKLDASQNQKLNFEKGGKDSEIIKANLKQELYAQGNIIRDEEVDLSAVITGQLASREEIEVQRLNTTLNKFFANNVPARDYFENHFTRELGLSTVIHIGKTLKDSQIVDSQKTLNENIEKFLSEQYFIVFKYLKNLGLASKLPNSMFKVHNPVGTYLNTMDRFYNLISHKSKIGSLEDEVEAGWRLKEEGSKSDTPSLYEAMNAYLSVIYFDKLSKQAIGDYISIDKNEDYPIRIDKDNIPHYKYRFGKDTENRVHGWEVDVRDAIKEMGNFSKFLISSIPIDDTYLTPVNYINAFANLIRATSQLSGGTEVHKKLYNAIISFNQNPVTQLREILSIINNNSSIRKFLLTKKISNPYELKVFDAVYEYIYKGSNSLFEIESNYNKVKGLSNRYPLVESLAAQIASSSGMQYLQTVYNWNEEQYETDIKKKYQVNKQFYDRLRAINIDNQNSEESPYKIEYANGKYVIDLGDNILEVSARAEENPYGILTKRQTTKGVTAVLVNKTTGTRTNVENVFAEADLSTKAKRQILIDSNSNSKLMEVLSFMDFFTGTNFATNQDGLLEFDLFKSNFKNSPMEALYTAVRGLVVRDIHIKFRNAVNDGKYNSSQIEQFIKDTKIYRDTILGIDPNDRDWRSIWEPSIFGPDLISISNSQDWLNNYVVIKQVMSGEISVANTKNLAGDSVPNYGLAFMGSNLSQIINDKQHKNDSLESFPLDTNLFMLNKEVVKETVIDTDVRFADGTSKAVKEMTEGELFYHAFVNKFIIPLVLNEENNRSIYIQPTTYSDKTKFVNYRLGTKFNGKDITKMSNTELVNLYVSSIGGGYRTVLKRILQDYAQIFDMQDTFNLAYAEKENPVLIRQMISNIDRQLNNYTEQELIALAKRKGVKSEILADTHFRYNRNRKRKTEVSPGKFKEKQFLSFNESLYRYAYETYTKEKLPTRLADEKRKFLNQLLKNKVNISGIRVYNYKADPNNLFTQALKYFDESANSWIKSDGELILAKVDGEDITTHDLIPEGTSVELNPLLDKFFMIHSLLGNNLRMVLTGSEISHKNKHLIGMQPNVRITQAINPNNKSTLVEQQDENVRIAINKAAQAKGLNPQEFWNTMSLIEAQEVVELIPDITTRNKARKAVRRMFYEVEAFGQGAQLKRNVIIPATMRYYTQNSLRGIASTMRIAVMDDIQAPVFNFIGQDATIDSHDGAAFINPITSILENWSLQENEVGTVKKPIWHYYDKEHMTSSLVKFAAHTITNNMMQQSQDARVDMLKLFRKMTNKPWALQGNILQYAAHKPSGKIKFSDLTGDNNVYYLGANGIHYKIIDFGYENGSYYTDEVEVDRNGIGSKLTRKYHYFDAQNNHIISTKPKQLDVNLHTMSCIYEAHQIFGGINSESLIKDDEHKNGILRLSEASNYIVANLINNVTIAKDPEKKNREFSQTDYEQPLKTLMVDYICNNSAIKNGAGNRNSVDRFSNDEALDTITLGTEYYGIQMDADHEADEAEMSEFSQVISALDAGGRLHDYVKGIYQALGQIALEEAAVEMKSIIAYQQNPTAETRDALYDIIGRTIINNISTSRGQAGLADSIIYQIKKRFNLSNAHALDDLKIPFSDSNIYSSILSTYASIITNKSIREKYPGLGAVLSPGYNIMMVYDIDGKVYQYKDLVKVASSSYKKYKEEKVEGKEHLDDNYYALIKAAEDKAKSEGLQMATEVWTQSIVKAFLQKKTDNFNATKWKYKVVEIPGRNPDWDLHTEDFMPTDNVGMLTEDATGKQEWLDVSLDNISDYYLFKANPRAFAQDKLNKPVKVLEFRKNLHKARNLAPTKIWWEYKGKASILQEDGTIKEVDVTRTTNIFNSIHMFKSFAKIIQKDIEKNKGNFTQVQLNDVNAYIERLKAQGVKEYANTQQLLDELDEGTYNGTPITLYNTPAELIMSNIYQTRFGVGVDESMIDIMQRGVNKKAKPIRQVHSSVDAGFYDLVMMKDNGRHTYISLDRTFESTTPDEDGNLPDVSYRWTYWRDNYRESIVDNKIINEVYATTKDRKPTFKIGRDIRRKDLSYSVDGNYFYYTTHPDEKIENDKKLRYINGEVIEYVEFVTRHEVTDKGRKHTVYNINVQELKRTITPEPKELKDGHMETPEQALDRQANDYIQKLIKEMYQADSYELFTVNNKQVKASNLKRLQNILKGYVSGSGYSTLFDYDKDLSGYLNGVITEFLKIPQTTEFRRPDLSYNAITGAIEFKGEKNQGSFAKILSDRTQAHKLTLNYRKYYSFLRSQYYTASRIPAQTLQSFMNMRQVGYTEEGSNLAYVSHWQTWLQGSDYDIDKAYIMGLAFDDNGQYIGWSSLFDFNDLDTIKASEYLPLPRNGVKIYNSEGGVDISEENTIITQADAKLKKELDANSISKFKVARMKAYVSIFNKLGDKTYVKGASQEVLDNLNRHNDTKLPAEIKAQALRNFISVHIQNTIQNVRNAADAYIPVDMEDLRDAADNSPKGAEALEITLMNPLSIYTMQYQNMVGKRVIAISATGQKAAFMWTFFTNEAIKNAKEGVDYIKTEDGIEVIPNSKLAQSIFNFTTSRIAGRSKVVDGVPQLQEVTTSTLPDINIEGITDPLLINYLQSNKLTARIPVDILISQMISAATDNAKELILAKINAGQKLAKCYLYLMAMGYDINDIVKFMTSDAVSWIDQLSDPNSFLGQDIRVEQAIVEIEKYLKNYELYKEADTLEDEFGSAIKDSSQKLALLKSIIPSNLTSGQIQEALADIQEFKNVYKGSDEFSAFGRLLSINQGLPGKAEDLEATLNKIRKIMITREKDLGIIDKKGNINTDNLSNIKDLDRYNDIYGGKFDPIRWLQDKEYQQRVAEYYDQLKISLNVFAMASSLPHFKSMFNLLGGECTVNEFSVKSRILSACLQKINKECPTLYIDDKYYSRILGFASQIMMQQFVEDNNFTFPIEQGPIIKSNRTISNIKTKGSINLGSEEGIASFKYYFENIVIPGLKAGTYGTWSDDDEENGRIREILRKNAFISSLMRGNDRDVPLWKMDINVSSDSAYTRIQLSEYSKGLKQLQNYNIGDMPLSDWFALYNLIVNKNQYGSDRLTKIFDNFIKDYDSKGNNLINKYLRYVGNQDYTEQDISKIMNFTAMDLFISQARIVTSLKGQTDPVVIMYEDKVPVYYRREGYQYVKMDEILPPVTGESVEQKLHRFYLQRAYFVLSKPYSEIIGRMSTLLNTSPITAISELIRQGKILLDIQCV